MAGAGGSEVFACPITRRSLRGWRSPRGLTFPLWDGIPVLVPDPDALLAAAAGGAPPADLLGPFLSPASLGAPGALGAWLANETRTPVGLAAAWGSQHAPPGPALDAGCGLGAMALSMASRARPTWAIDRDPHTLTAARDIMLGRTRTAPWTVRPGVVEQRPLPVLPLRPPQVRLAVADIRTPPFAPGAFTWVHLGMAPTAAVVAAAAELLVGGGLLTLATDHAAPDGPGEPEDVVIDAVADAGLVVVAEAAAVPRVRRRDGRHFAVAMVHCVAARKGAAG